MGTSNVKCWHIGLPGRFNDSDGIVAFTARELNETAPFTNLHES